MNQFQKKVKPHKMMLEYLRIINCQYNFTYREIEVLALILDYLYDVKYNGAKELNSIDLRKQIMGKTSINKNNLSKYLKVYEDAGVIIRNPDTNIPAIATHIEPIFTDGIIEVNFKVSCNG